jgi:hypothetical protein
MRRYFSGAPRESIRYLNHAVRFDTRMASRLLERHGVPVPCFEDYVENMVSFFKSHEHDPALVPPEV